MKIAIIGAGNVGSTLGEGWRAVGHTITYGVPQPEDSKYLSLKAHSTVTSTPEAVKDSEIVVLATPWSKTQEAILQIGEALEGKVLVDCTNPLKPDLSGLSVGHITSGAEQIAQWAPKAKVVKAFNTTGFNIMTDPVLEGRKTVMFVASDDAAARKQVAELATELGFDAVEVGELATARLLEPFALLWISMAYRYGLGRDFGFAIVKR